MTEELRDEFNFRVARSRTRETSTLTIATVTYTASLLLLGLYIQSDVTNHPAFYKYRLLVIAYGFLFPLVGFYYRHLTITGIANQDEERIRQYLGRQRENGMNDLREVLLLILFFTVMAAWIAVAVISYTMESVSMQEKQKAIGDDKEFDWLGFAGNIAGVLIGALVGALVGFWLGIKQDRRKRREEQREMIVNAKHAIRIELENNVNMLFDTTPSSPEASITAFRYVRLISMAFESSTTLGIFYQFESELRNILQDVYFEIEEANDNFRRFIDTVQSVPLVHSVGGQLIIRLLNGIAIAINLSHSSIEDSSIATIDYLETHLEA